MQTGIKALWKHNLYGLTPDIGCAHQLLVRTCSFNCLLLFICRPAWTFIMFLSWMQLHAKQHNDAKLMVKVIKVLMKNDIPLQPGTADIIFRYMLSNKPFQFLYYWLFWISILTVWFLYFLSFLISSLASVAFLLKRNLW